MQFSFTWPIDRTRSGATTPGQSGPRNECNEGVFRIPPKLQQHYWNLTIRLLSFICTILFLGGGSYPSAEKQSVYSTAPDDWIKGHSLEKGALLLCRDAVGVFYSPNRLGNCNLSFWGMVFHWVIFFYEDLQKRRLKEINLFREIINIKYHGLLRLSKTISPYFRKKEASLVSNKS